MPTLSKYREIPSALQPFFSSHLVSPTSQSQAHLVRGGSGTPLVLLHGWPQSWRIWSRIMPALAEDYQVIALDLPGIAGSDPLAVSHTTPAVAHWLEQIVRRLDLNQPLHVIGHDVGAWVALAFAAYFPQRVRTLTLLDSALPGLTPDAFFQLKPEGRMWHFHVHANPGAVQFFIEGRVREYVTWFISKRRFNMTAFADDEITYHAELYSQPEILDAGFSYYRSLAESIRLVRQKLIEPSSLPALLLGGEHARAASMLEEALPKFPRAVGGVIGDCGHYLPEEASEQLLQQLRPFLKRHNTESN